MITKVLAWYVESSCAVIIPKQHPYYPYYLLITKISIKVLNYRKFDIKFEGATEQRLNHISFALQSSEWLNSHHPIHNHNPRVYH